MGTEAQQNTTPGKISAKPKTPQKVRELLPEDDYLFAVKWVEKGVSQNGKARLSFKFEVAAGPKQGKKAFEDCYLTDDAIWKVQNLAALCGIPEDQEIDPNDPKDLISKFQGKTFHGSIKHEEYTNKDGALVKAQRVLWFVPQNSKRDPATADAGTEEDKKGDLGF